MRTLIAGLLLSSGLVLNAQNAEVEKLSSLIIGVPGLRDPRPTELVMKHYMKVGFFRKVEGVTYDLRSFEASRRPNSFVGRRPPQLDDWGTVSGKVISVTSEGVLLLKLNNSVIFVTGALPGEPVDGRYFWDIYAKHTGAYQYTSVAGALKTVPLYDCGTEDYDAFQKAFDILTKGAIAFKEAEHKALTEKLSAADVKALEFQVKRAQEGSASAQYDLGIRYLDGKGVERNEDKALEWLKKSAAQDNIPAKQKLKELGK